LTDHSWLDGRAGGTRQIGKLFFEKYAKDQGLETVRSGIRGLIPDFSGLEERNVDLAAVSPAVREFYEQTSEFELDAWSEWNGLFRPFGKALSWFFSSRLQQLNVPLSPLDASRGMTSSVVQMRDPQSGTVYQTAWVRELHGTGNVLYAGSYSICCIPGHPSPCVKVVFPLPNGNAVVLMKPEGHPDGSLTVRSVGGCSEIQGFTSSCMTNLG
jgi:hypothetical protein